MSDFPLSSDALAAAPSHQSAAVSNIGPSSRGDLYSTLSSVGGGDVRAVGSASLYSEAEEEGVARRGPPARNAAQGQQSRVAVHKVVDLVALEVEKAFAQFLESFVPADAPSSGRSAHYIAKMDQMKTENTTTLLVDMQHLREADLTLAETVASDFRRFSPYLNKALQSCVEKYYNDYLYSGNTTRDFWVSFVAMPHERKIRELQANLIGQLETIKGTVTRTSIVRPELLLGTFQCVVCKEVYADVPQQFAYSPPSRCTNPMCNNTEGFDLLTERSKFVDWQKIRIQENANEIPAGSTPRSMDVIVRHEMCERAKPGDVCVFTGTVMAIPDVAQILMSGRHLNLQKSLKEMGRKRDNSSGTGISGLKQLGCRELAYRLVFIATTVQTAADKYAHFYEDGESNDPRRSDYIASLLTPAQREEMLSMIDSKTNYQDLINSIAPTIFGHERIKEGILLQLLGGVHKTTPEGTNKLRGDLNVCIVGDPGLSKSQFLKYVTGFLPRSVYTSGKASSAAGLTAAVVKDEETGDFTIEAGALMLADNGICCIDEFDKMEIKDQVAIHEAMEQQTISIAKAGIHATLNARTSILAAANPVGGRYDKSKSLKQNVNMSPPIMSRFDLFFVVLDTVQKERDYLIARHILQVHRDRDEAINPKYTTDMLRRFIMFAKALRPKLSAEASELLVETYKGLRRADTRGARRSGYRVTVRQLESLIRLSEAMARAHAEPEVKVEHVRAASRLLRSSMPQTEKGEVDLDEDEVAPVAVAEGDDAAMEAAEPVDANAAANADAVPADEQQAAPRPAVTIKANEYHRLCQLIVSMMAEREHQRRVELALKKSQAQAASADSEAAMDTEERELPTLEGAALHAERVAATAAKDAAYEDETATDYGMKFKEVVEWYLDQIEDQIATEEEYAAEQKLIAKVLKRMVRKERLLLAVTSLDDSALESAGEEARLDDETLLIIHPSVDTENLGVM